MNTITITDDEASRPKRPTDLVPYGWAPGEYWCKCHGCGEAHWAEKRASSCLSCALKKRDATLEADRARAVDEGVLVEALKYYACEDGSGKDWVLCPRGKYDPIQTLYDIGHRARAALAAMKGEGK